MSKQSLVICTSNAAALPTATWFIASLEDNPFSALRAHELYWFLRSRFSMTTIVDYLRSGLFMQRVYWCHDSGT